MSKKDDRANILLKQIADWMEKDRLSGEEAVEKLSIQQYDFLVDYGVNLDNLLLTPEQLKAASEVKRVKRAPSPNGYNKKYPQEKQDLYSSICKHLEGLGAEIIPREKQNFRDLDFTLNGTKYRIVLSNPRS